MNNLRLYGQAPYRTAVIHGGPGAGGEMKPVAQVLAERMGVLEPMQTAHSVAGQIEELNELLHEANASFPVTLIGYSWGAWLAVLFTAKYPKLVQKVVLVDSGPFEDSYVAKISEIRNGRLTNSERQELDELFKGGPDDKAFARIGELTTKTDNYDALPHESDADIKPDMSIYEDVWPQAARMRTNGELLQAVADIQCPIVAIHGDYDPHPADGVKLPLSRVAKDFKFILLQSCGHTPWRERTASESFYDKLTQEIVA